MIETIKNILEKLFWPLIIVYGLFIIYKIWEYQYSLKHTLDKDVVNNLYAYQMIIVGLIVGVALLLKLWGHGKIGSLILGIPALITAAIFIISVLVIAFLALLFILFGNN